MTIHSPIRRLLKHGRVRLFTAGMLFFLNPMIGTVDILPDAIGAILCLLALRNTAFLSPYFARAERLLYLYLALSLVKIPASVLLFYLTGRYQTQTTLFPLFSFSATVLELLLLLPAFIALYRAAALYGERRGPFTSGYDGMFPALPYLTVGFFILRGLCAFLPDMLYLTDDAAGTSLTGFYPLCAVFSVLPVLIVAYGLFGRFRRFLNGFFGDSEICASLNADIAALAPRIARDRACRAQMHGWLYLMLSALFAVDLPISGNNLLPDIFVPLLIALAVTSLRRGGVTVSPLRNPLILAAATALAADIANALYFRTYTLRDIYHSAAAERLYIPVLCIDALAVAAAIYLYIRLLKPLAAAAAATADESFAADSPIRRVRDRYRHVLARYIRVFCVSGIALSLIEFTVAVTKQFPVAYPADTSHVTGGEIVLPALDFLFSLLTALAIARFGYMLWARAVLAESVAARYTDEAD